MSPLIVFFFTCTKIWFGDTHAPLACIALNKENVSSKERKTNMMSGDNPILIVFYFFEEIELSCFLYKITYNKKMESFLYIINLFFKFLWLFLLD
jgi:hypothetical protein